MQRKSVSFSLVALAALFAGCEWTSTSGSDSWSGSYDEMNFGGTYRMTKVTTVGTSESGDTQPVQTMSFGVTENQRYTYNGSVGMAIIPGTVSISITGMGAFADLTSNGNLTPASGVNGTAKVTYGSGDWEFTLAQNPGSGHTIKVQFQASPLASGSSSYSYTGIDTKSFDPSYVTAVTVSQTGQNLTMTLNNGVAMSGRFTSVRQTAAVSEDTGAGANTYNAQFQVSSGSSSKMVGTLYYDYPSHNRMLDATWTFGKSTFDVHAIGPAWNESGVTTDAETAGTN